MRKLDTKDSVTRKPMWAVECSRCKSLGKSAVDPGDASELARKQGFTTVRMGEDGEPMSWLCKHCRKN